MRRDLRSQVLERDRPTGIVVALNCLLPVVSSCGSKTYPTLSPSLRACSSQVLISSSVQSLSVQIARTWSFESGPRLEKQRTFWSRDRANLRYAKILSLCWSSRMVMAFCGSKRTVPLNEGSSSAWAKPLSGSRSLSRFSILDFNWKHEEQSGKLRGKRESMTIDHRVFVWPVWPALNLCEQLEHPPSQCSEPRALPSSPDCRGPVRNSSLKIYLILGSEHHLPCLPIYIYWEEVYFIVQRPSRRYSYPYFQPLHPDESVFLILIECVIFSNKSSASYEIRCLGGIAWFWKYIHMRYDIPRYLPFFLLFLLYSLHSWRMWRTVCLGAPHVHDSSSNPDTPLLYRKVFWDLHHFEIRYPKSRGRSWGTPPPKLTSYRNPDALLPPTQRKPERIE